MWQSNLRAIASNLLAMASNLRAMASNLDEARLRIRQVLSVACKLPAIPNTDDFQHELEQ